LPRAARNRPGQRAHGYELFADTGIRFGLGPAAVHRRAMNVGQVIGDLANGVDVPCR
jgi:hypothetical protein